jgi:N-acetylmuramoyl-L-alanine amidase
MKQILGYILLSPIQGGCQMRWGIWWACLLSCLCNPVWAQVLVKNVELNTSHNSPSLILNLSGPVDHRVFLLSNPNRAVIDLSNAKLLVPLPAIGEATDTIRELRGGIRHGVDLRIVIDLTAPVRPRATLTSLDGRDGYRLAIDLVSMNSQNAVKGKASVLMQDAQTPAAEELPAPKMASVTVAPEKRRKFIVAIDAGHGGNDPGAVGRGGTHEKDVTLAVARQLAEQVNDTPGMRAVLIRDGDYFLGLRERIQKARMHHADLFISIHADSYLDKAASGSSVYVLSQRGASSEAARWLAARENAADLIGGVSLDDKDQVLASVLLDLSQTATIGASLDLGGRVLGQLRQLGPLHKQDVQQAGFLVLKSPDIPSILVETAFISNPREERRLKDPSYRHQLAGAILAGVNQYMVLRASDARLATSEQN